MLTRTSDKLRVLLIAEMCNPTWTSVPLVGYNMAAALSRHPGLEVTLATQIRNQLALADDPIHQTAKVEYIDTEYIAAPFHRLSKFMRAGKQFGWTIDTASMWPSYIAFEKQIARRFARDFDLGHFDIIHRLTPLSPTIPSPLASMTSVPMIFGPVNGGLPWPAEFAHLASREKEWLLPLRNVHRLLPYHRSTYLNLKGYISASRHTETNIPRHYRGERFFLPENGIDPLKFPIAGQWTKPNGKFQFITVGRLVPVKGIDMIMEAMAGEPSLADSSLVIVGDGPEKEKLEELAKSLKIGDRIRFTGWLAQAQISEELRSSQAFVFPSVKDFGGGAVLEAMASGLPAIVLDYGGPAELVSPETGIRIPMNTRDKLIPLLGQAMSQLAHNPGLCESMSRAAIERVSSDYTWDAKAAKIAGFYEQTLRPAVSANAEEDLLPLRENAWTDAVKEPLRPRKPGRTAESREIGKQEIQPVQS